MGRKSHNLTDEQKAERRREIARRYYQKNKEICNAKAMTYYEAHKEKISLYMKARYQRVKAEKLLQQQEVE